MTTTLPDAAEIKREALGMGFIACGITTLEPNGHAAFLDEWLAAGYAGTMRYLHRQAAKRKEPALATPGARTAIVVLENYAAPESERAHEGEAYKVAAYARGIDYHTVTQSRLDALGDWLRSRGATIAHARVDAGPVPERELASRAGLGWIGKNSMLIHPRLGSYTFIGTIFTDLDLVADAPMRTDHCGTCTRCLDACPTQAFVAPQILDATRCISYLTIEFKGDPPPELEPHYDGWAFGCDICNDVCPWNLKFATPTAIPEFARRDAPDRSDPHYFDEMSDDTFLGTFAGTPFTRPGLNAMRRNVRIARRDPQTTARDS